MPFVQPRKHTACCIVSGLLMIGIGIFIVVFIPFVLMPKLVHDNFAVDSPTAKGLSSFQFFPREQATIYQSYHIYNLTNPAEVEAGTAGPIITEHGPYTYRMDKTKTTDSLTWRANATLEYVMHTEFTFMPEMSKGSESDVFTTPNLGYIGALNKVRDSPLLVDFVKYEIEQNKIPLFFVNKLNVSQFLWGYNNELLEVLGQPAWIEMQTKNDWGKPIGRSAVFTGGDAVEGDYSPVYNDIKRMTMWNSYDKYLPYWNSSYANMINGTDGTSFHPYLTDDDVSGEGLHVFSDTIYRSAFLVECFKKDVNGVKVRCVHMRDDMLQSGDEVPANKDFFMTTTGFIPFPKAVGKPIHVSLPHFFKANFSSPLVNTVKYADADPSAPCTIETCDTVLCVEPFTGQLLNAHKRLQINTLLEPNVTVPGTTIPTFLPLMWVDQFPVITEGATNQIKLKIYLPYYGSLVLGPFLMALGLLFIIVATVRCTCCQSNGGGGADKNGGDELFQPLATDNIAYHGGAAQKNAYRTSAGINNGGGK